jgi:DNA-binding FadR family transcriptional regulator
MNSSHKGKNKNLAGPKSHALHDNHIAGQILALIQKHNLEAGAKLPSERSLAENLGCSRNTVREALAGLEGAGVVEIRKRSGCYFTGHMPTGSSPANGATPSLFDAYTPWEDKKNRMTQAMDALYLVGPKIIHMAALNCSTEHIQALETTTSNLGRALVERKPGIAHQCLAEFYAQLARMQDNRYLWHFFREIGAMAEQMPGDILWATHGTEEKVEHFFARHIETLQALREQDPDNAAAHSKQAVLAYMALHKNTTPKGDAS